MTDDPFADLPDAPVVEEKVDGRKKKSKGPKQRSFFDCLTVIYKTKDEHQMEDDIASSNFGTMYSPYMCQRYLSMHPPYLKLIQDQQHVLEAMDAKSHYRYLFKLIPKNPRLWIKYIAKKKSK
jgi:hypothetical protein